MGRDEQLARFRRNLDFSIEDSERLYVFNIYGQAGVGKRGWCAACVRSARRKGLRLASQTSQADVLEVMERFSAVLKEQGSELKKFDDRIRVYRQRRQELETDPKAPKGTLHFILRSVAKAGISAADRTVGGGMVLDAVDKETLTLEAAEWGAYIGRKFTNKDELSLVREPIETLTPIFVSDLRHAAHQRRLALFFDTYERTSVS